MTLSFSQVVETLGMQRLGASHVMSWMPSVGADFRYYLTSIDSALVGWHASVATEPELCAQVLASVTPEYLAAVSAERPVAFLRRALPSFPECDGIAVIHPAAARYTFNKATEAMVDGTYLVFPCHRCELTDDDSVDEIRARLGARLLTYSRPDRSPFPAIAMRYGHLLPKPTKSSGGKKLGIFSNVDVSKHTQLLISAGGFVELENWERRCVTLTAAGSHVSLSEKKGKSIELFEDELIPWLDAFTMKTADDAMNGIRR